MQRKKIVFNASKRLSLSAEAMCCAILAHNLNTENFASVIIAQGVLTTVAGQLLSLNVVVQVSATHARVKLLRGIVNIAVTYIKAESI